MSRDVWVIDAVRSPRGSGKPTGGLHGVHPQRVLAQTIDALRSRVGFEPSDVDDVIIGNQSGSGDHGMDIARMAVLDAGWPLDAPGVTVNRFCGSGQQAVTFGAMAVLSGHQDLVVVGGVESMSRASALHNLDFTAGNPHLAERFPMVPQGISADLIATLGGFSRHDVDQLAVDSQTRAAEAIAEGRFARSLVTILNDDDSLALDHDEHPRPDTTLDGLGRLAPSFEGAGKDIHPYGNVTMDEAALAAYPQLSAIDHVHHAGNSSGIVDGASALLLAPSEYARAHGLVPRARITMTAVAGDDPVIMLTAPAPAARRCCDKAGMSLADIDLFEVNEAFASVVLHFLQQTGVDWSKVNVNGGAIALGHPIGATGGMLIGTIIDELERRGLGTGLVTMCTGGGMATATIVERV